MGNPLGPIMANIFVGFEYKQMFGKVSKRYCYVRYVDDTFAFFTSHSKVNRFFQQPSSLLTVYDGRKK